jgi:hypothetical protein
MASRRRRQFRRPANIDDTDEFEHQVVREYCREQYGSEPRFRGDVVEIERAWQWHRVGTVESIVREVAGEPAPRRIGRRC